MEVNLQAQLIETDISEVLLIETVRFEDERGFFMESFNKQLFEELGIPVNYVQDNHSLSKNGVIRGIHYQNMTAPIGKLVRCTVGKILDVAVDLRVGSPTFGKYVKATLSEENNRLLYLPEGFGHAFLSLADRTEIQYKCTGYYSPSSEGTVLWKDSKIGIDWDVLDPSVSPKDKKGQTLDEYLKNPAFVYGD